MSEQKKLRGFFITETPTRRQIKREIKPKLDEAIRRADYEGFKEILISCGISPGSERFRVLEASFWQAVSERRKMKMQGL